MLFKRKMMNNLHIIEQNSTFAVSLKEILRLFSVRFVLMINFQV